MKGASDPLRNVTDGTLIAVFYLYDACLNFAVNRTFICLLSKLSFTLSFSRLPKLQALMQASFKAICA